MMELEEARGQKKDPRSFSRIRCFGKCLCGPEGLNSGPKVANTINFIMLVLNFLSMSVFLEGNLTWLVAANIILGIMTQILMWCVQCSDPGIINRS